MEPRPKQQRVLLVENAEGTNYVTETPEKVDRGGQGEDQRLEDTGVVDRNITVSPAKPNTTLSQVASSSVETVDEILLQGARVNTNNLAAFTLSQTALSTLREEEKELPTTVVNMYTRMEDVRTLNKEDNDDETKLITTQRFFPSLATPTPSQSSIYWDKREDERGSRSTEPTVSKTSEIAQTLDKEDNIDDTKDNKQTDPSFASPSHTLLCHTDISRAFLTIEKTLCDNLVHLTYGDAVKYVYNPVEYAKELHEDFVLRFCRQRKCVLLLGMNPGPWGMGQTGVPFGHVGYARDWLKVQGRVERPAQEHPKRPVLGLDCTRKEVSGERMWSLLRDLAGSPEALFSRVFIHNYCPIFFLKDSGKNITPPELKVKERVILEKLCDAALVDVVVLLGVTHVVGVGRYAAERTNTALKQAGLEDVKVSTLMHPSPVNPAANKGWRDIAIKQLTESGVIQYFQP